MHFTHLLDTSVLSQPMKDQPLEAVLNRWSLLREDRLCTSALCTGEILRGLHARNAPRFWNRYRALIEAHYPSLPFDAAVAATFGRLHRETAAGGKTRPMVDLMIAATATHHGLILATLNARDFAGIPGLVVEDWGRSPRV